MARTAVLGGGGLSPFGGGGADFGAFDIVDPGREAYLQYLKVKVDWEQGNIPNAAYLTAYETYVNAQPAGSSNRIDAEQSLRDTRYRLERNDLLAAVEAGTKTWNDLITYDKGKLEGLDHGSQEYLDRLNLYQQTQAKVLSDAAQEQHDLYDAGKLTSTQLRQWYRDQGARPEFADNPDLLRNIADQIKGLDLRVVSETDNHMIQMFNDGKLGSAQFLVYAAAARSRYSTGTEQEQQWTKLIDDAKQQTAEKSLTYRYGLSQQYIQLQKFIKDQSAMLAKSGSGSTSTSQRIVLGADGQWKTVTSTSTSPYKPSAAEVKAMADRKIELADAKKQMAELTGEISGNGGFVSTDSMISFYSGRQGQYVKGSPEWYQIQERLDSLDQQKHAEAVLKAEGVHVTYGGSAGSGSGGGSGPTQGSSSGGGTGLTSSKSVSIDAFMRAIAKVESGGSYGATNKSSGAYGKYQIMPSNWPSWAQHYLGDASAQPTPDNQEKVARAKMLDLYKKFGSWEQVAHWWLTGNGSGDTSTWSASSTRYVNKVMSGVGIGPVSVTGGGTKLGTVANPTTGGSTAAAAAPKGPLQVVTGTLNVPSKTGDAAHQELTSRAASFPTNLDGQAFLKFYAGFNAAFDAGETTFTDWSSGRAVTYSIPADLGQRATMMQTLDDLRISYYQKRAQVYAGTPSELVAANEYSNAIKDKADNAYTILITGQPKGAEPAPGTKNAIDPIALGLAAQQKAEIYVKDQYRLAQQAFDRGDVTGAYAHIQLAQKTMAETDQKMQFFGQQAAAAIGAIEQGSGESAPSKVQTDFEKLANWQDSTGLKTTLEQMDKLQGELTGDPEANKPGWLETDAQGNPVWHNGTVKLRDGAAIFLDPSGNVTYKDIPSAGYAKPGSKEQVPAVPGYVPITMNAGGSVVGDQSGGVVVYAKWEAGVVGFTSSGAPIYGKVVSGQLNGKRYTYVEDPFHPGKWSAGNITFNVPPGFSAVPGAKEGSTVYQFTGSDGAQYRLDWDATNGQYNVIKAGNLLSGDQVLPAGDADTLSLLDSSGFKVDLSSVAPDDLWMYNMNGAHPGFDKGSWTQFTKPQTSPSRPRGVVVPGAGGVQFSGIPWGGMERGGTLRNTPPTTPNISGSPDDRQAAADARQQAANNALIAQRAGERGDLWQLATLSSQSKLNTAPRPDDPVMHGLPALATPQRLPTVSKPLLDTFQATKAAALSKLDVTPATTSKTPTSTKTTSTAKRPTPTPVKTVAPLPQISTTKLAAITKLAGS